MIAGLVYLVAVLGPATPVKQLWNVAIKPGDQLGAGRSVLWYRELGSADYVFFDPATGRKRFRVADVRHVKQVGGVILVAKPDSIDALDPWSGERRWHVDTEASPNLGAIVGSNLYFGDAAGVTVAPIPSGKVLSRRQIPGAPSPRVETNGVRIFVASWGHTIYGLDPRDLAKGWSNYCDLSMWETDEDGIYCFGALFFQGGYIQNNGELQWTTWKAPRLLIRQPPAIGRRCYVQGGSGGDKVRPSTVVSPYLFGLNKKTGELMWQVPMIGLFPAEVGDSVVVLAGHRTKPSQTWDVYFGDQTFYRGSLEVRREDTGRLIWRSGPIDPKPQVRFGLASDGESRFFWLEGTRLRGYGVRGTARRD